jgi:hypothetical protein
VNDKATQDEQEQYGVVAETEHPQDIAIKNHPRGRVTPMKLLPTGRQ